MSNNILVQVQTYNDSGLALLVNSFAFMNIGNSKFDNFENIEKQLGDTVLFDKPPRFTTTGSLVVSFQDVEQRVQTLTVDKQESVAYNFTAQQFIFNVRDYMEKFGASAVAELGSKIEGDLATVCETAPYRFYGDGVTPISSYKQLASSLAFFRNFGAAKDNTVAVLDDLTFPNVVNSGLNQFVPTRNDREAMSWEIGSFSKCDWKMSNLLPVHTAGTEGNAGSTLTVVSTTLDASGAVIAITFSGTHNATDANSVLAYDSFEFNDGVANVPNIRFLTWIGHFPSQSPVQFAAIANAAASGSQVTVSCNPPLQANSGKNQNITAPIMPGMQVSVLPSHRCGVIMSGRPFYFAIPRLPDESPFDTARSTDPDSGVSLRTYFGSQFGQNSRGMVHDAIWGKTMVSEYSMKVAIPL